MENFVRQQNLAHFRNLLAAAAKGSQREQILKLLVEEEAKDKNPSK